MQAFDMIGARDTEPRHGGVRAERMDFLLQRHAGEQVGDAVFGSRVEVLIDRGGQYILSTGCEGDGNEAQEEGCA